VKKRIYSRVVRIFLVLLLLVFVFSVPTQIEAEKKSGKYLDIHAIITTRVMWALEEYTNDISHTKTDYAVLYYTNQTCHHCAEDAQEMFEELFYNSNLVNEKKITVFFMSRSDFGDTFRFLAESMAKVFYRRGDFKKGVLPSNEEVIALLSKINFAYRPDVTPEDLSITGDEGEKILESEIFPSVVIYGPHEIYGPMPNKPGKDGRAIYALFGQSFWSGEDLDSVIERCSKEDCLEEEEINESSSE